MKLTLTLEDGTNYSEVLDEKTLLSGSYRSLDDHLTDALHAILKNFYTKV